MRFFLLLVLAISLAAAVPQSRRGSRRFSLATPGLLSGNRDQASNDDTKAEAAETSPPASSQSARPRSRLTPRLRGRPTSQAAPSQEPVKAEAPEPTQTSSNPEQGGGRLRLRRPIKKVITTTTTTTTTTEAPEPDQMAEKEMKDAPVEESIQATPEKAEKKQMEKTESEPAPESVTEEPETAASKAPAPPKAKPPKLRPIPIKLGLRGGAAPAPEKKPAEPEPTPAEDSTPVNSGPSHRFAARREKGPRIQLRGRGSRGNQPEAQPDQGEAEAPAESSPGSPRVRGRFSRISPRGRTSQAAQEDPAAQTGESETAPAAETPQRRFPNIKKPRRRGGERLRAKGKSKLKRRKNNSLRFRRPLPSTVKSKKESTDYAEITKKHRDDVEISKDPREEDTKIAKDPREEDTKIAKDPREEIEISKEPREDMEISKGPKEDVESAKQIKETDLNLPLPPPTSDDVLGKPLPLDTESSPIETMSPSSEAPVDILPPVKTTQKSTTSTIQVPLDVEEPVPAITSDRVRISPRSRTSSGSVSPPLRTRQKTPSSQERSRGYRGNPRSTKIVGTVEDTPANEVRRILSGLGSRRRGLSRVSDVELRESAVEDSVPVPSVPQVQETLPDADYAYDYYDYLLNEGY